MKPERRLLLVIAVSTALPLLMVVLAGSRTIGRVSVDLAWTYWRIWSASRGEVFSSSMIGYPEGVNLLPSAGGWLDVVIGGPIALVVGPLLAYNIVCGVMLLAAGLGGTALCRVLGASWGASMFGGILLQFDGFILSHLVGGRLELASLGFCALAIALAIRSWRHPGWPAAVGAGLAGALAIWGSWELGLLLAVIMVVLGPPIWRGPRAPGAIRRWVGAAVLCAALTLPLVVVFLGSAAPHLGEDSGFGLALAMNHSVGVVGLFGFDNPRTGWLVFLTMLAAPCVIRREDRLLWLVIGLGLLAAFLCALGPSPSVGGPARVPPESYLEPWFIQEPAAAWAPFTWLQSLPILERFHWPERLLAVFSLAGVPLAALAVDEIGRRAGRNVAWMGAASLLLLGAVEVMGSGRVPVGKYHPRFPRGIYAIAHAPGPGAVLALPVHAHPPRYLDFHLEQTLHQRPMLLSMQLAHLGGRSDLLDTDPVLHWFATLSSGERTPPRVFRRTDFAGLEALGYRFVILHRIEYDEATWQRMRRALDGLGEPLHEERGWAAWDLTGETPPVRPERELPAERMPRRRGLRSTP